MSRIYNKEICATITGTAREGLEHIAKKVEGLGHEVIYGDNFASVVIEGRIR